MVGYLRCFFSIYAVVLTTCMPQLVTSQQHDNQFSLRRLDVMIGNSNEYAETVVSLLAPERSLGIGFHNHAKITSILSTTKEMISTAKVLIDDSRTLKEGTEMMEEANAMFKEVTDHIAKRNLEDQHGMLENYSEHDIHQVDEDEERALDIARSVYEVMISFPECVEKLLQDCLDMINQQVVNLGLATLEIIVHEKRYLSQPGYNKVVIITNDLADCVKGRAGDGIVTYPFLWDDFVTGLKSLGVDGKWNCVDITPEACWEDIKESAPSMDMRENYVECHIFVPFGGIGKPKRA